MGFKKEELGFLNPNLTTLPRRKYLFLLVRLVIQILGGYLGDTWGILGGYSWVVVPINKPKNI